MTSEDQNGSPASDKHIVWQCLIIGACALITAGIPFYVVGLQVRLDFPADRFTQPFAFGAALILAGLLELIPSLSWRRTVSSALVALAIGLQIQYGLPFVRIGNCRKPTFGSCSGERPPSNPERPFFPIIRSFPTPMMMP